jgi:pyruvate dehydrogenase E2 component (dihydrolipoamide acetyltransferase)
VKLFSNPDLVNRQMLEDMLKYKRLEGVEALRLLVSGLFKDGSQQLDLRGVVQDGQQPVLLIWGSDDAIIPVNHSVGLNAQVEVLPGQAHMVQMEAAEQVNPLILKFVQQH